MNASDLTTRIAEGIALWARVQNLAPSDRSLQACEARDEWADWELGHSAKLIEFVKAEQFALFDRVNAAF